MLAEPLVKPEVIAEMFDVSVRTVQRRAERGEIPYYRFGDQLRFSVAEVCAALRVERAA